MNAQVQFRLGLLVIVLSAAVASCKKNKNEVAIPAGQVYIAQAAASDTLPQKVSSAQDSVFIIKLQAAVHSTISGNHTVVFAVDTSQMVAYRAKYGNAQTLPLVNYNFPFFVSTINGGETTGTSTQLNIVQETRLQPATTYVLPVIIKTVDGQAPGQPGTGQVTYILIKTAPIDYGVPIDKTGWSVVSFSSQYTGYDAANVVGTGTTNFWWAFGVAMPQYVTIDMAQQHRLKAVTFYNSDYYAFGNNPTQIQIELSLDGNTWTNMGSNFQGGTPGTTIHKLLMKPITQARYIRFTVLQSTLYFAYYSGVTVADIDAND